MQCPGCDSTTDFERIASHWSGGCGYPSIPEDVRAVLDGLVLAGGAISGNGHNRYLTIGTTSQDLAEWTAAQLGWLCQSVRETEGDGQREVVYRVRTPAHPGINRYERWSHVGESSGRIPPERFDLSPRAARVWWAHAGGLEWSKPQDSARQGAFSSAADAKQDWIVRVLDDAGFDPTPADRRVKLRPTEVAEWLDWIGGAVPGAEYKWASEQSVYWILQGDPVAGTLACPVCDSSQITLRYHAPTLYHCDACEAAFNTPVGRAAVSPSYSDEDIQDCIRAAATAKGDPLSSSQYEEWRSEWGDGYPSSVTISQRQGWSQSCRDAGVEPGGPN